MVTSQYLLFTCLSSVWKVNTCIYCLFQQSNILPQINAHPSCHTYIQLFILSLKCNPSSLICGPWNISNYLHFTVGFTVKDLKMMISNDVVRLSKKPPTEIITEKPEKQNICSGWKLFVDSFIFFRGGHWTHLFIQASRGRDALFHQVV